MPKRLRVVGLAVVRRPRDGALLVGLHDLDAAGEPTFCRLLGGGVEFCERSDETVRRELRSEQAWRAQSVAKTASDQTVALRKEANSRIDKEVQIIGERIEQMSADLRELVETSSQALESRLDRMQQDVSEHFRVLEEGTRRRDDDLRAELLAVSAWLEDRKTSRHDLGQMLEEIGVRLQTTTPVTTDQPSDEE